MPITENNTCTCQQLLLYDNSAYAGGETYICQVVRSVGDGIRTCAGLIDAEVAALLANESGASWELGKSQNESGAGY